jgi:hypothetical protein
MKSPLLLLLFLAVLSFACAQRQSGDYSASAPLANTATKDSDKAVLADSAAETRPAASQAKSFSYDHATQQEVSLSKADQSQLVSEAVDRKIIRNAELSIEVDSPSEAQHRITSIADSQGGFVVTSEAKHQTCSPHSFREVRRCARSNQETCQQPSGRKRDRSGCNRGFHRS